jgi:flavin-dependent dehydrogenase
MTIDADVAVVGAGPAGLATAISARLRGCQVVLLEQSAFPRHRPGETLHPGLGPLFEQLGVEHAVSRFSEVRHTGIWVSWHSDLAFTPFGEDNRGHWRGYQIRRSDLDSLLLVRARELGVLIVQPSGRAFVLTDQRRTIGLRCDRCDVRVKFVVDASGSQSWLQRQLGLQLLKLSPRLIASYGYVESDDFGPIHSPSIVADGSTWTWIARINAGMCNWTRLATNSTFDGEVPSALRIAGSKIRRYGADVTWRTVHPVAGAGFFLVGDAAAALDPVSSHGVLRSLMSGMMVGYLVAQVLGNRQQEKHVISEYKSWFSEWLRRDISKVKDLYQKLDPPPPWLSMLTVGPSSEIVQ